MRATDPRWRSATSWQPRPDPAGSSGRSPGSAALRGWPARCGRRPPRTRTWPAHLLPHGRHDLREREQVVGAADLHEERCRPGGRVGRAAGHTLEFPANGGVKPAYRVATASRAAATGRLEKHELNSKSEVSPPPEPPESPIRVQSKSLGSIPGMPSGGLPEHNRRYTRSRSSGLLSMSFWSAGSLTSNPGRFMHTNVTVRLNAPGKVSLPELGKVGIREAAATAAQEDEDRLMRTGRIRLPVHGDPPGRPRVAEHRRTRPGDQRRTAGGQRRHVGAGVRRRPGADDAGEDHGHGQQRESGRPEPGRQTGAVAHAPPSPSHGLPPPSPPRAREVRLAAFAKFVRTNTRSAGSSSRGSPRRASSRI